MKVDIDVLCAAAKAKMPAWALSIECDGKHWPTREMTGDEFAAFQKPGQTEARQMEMLSSLFVDPKPPIETWAAERVMAAVAALLAYYVTRQRAYAAAATSMVAQQFQAEPQ